MDTSETYIKMRVKAIPDLGMGKPPEPFGEDIITGKDTFNWQTDKVFIDAKGGFYYSDEEVACQLERQDQLQEMVLPRGYDSEGLNSLLSRFTFFVLHPYKDKDEKISIPCERPFFEAALYICSYFPSMEQLWLAFVMKEKYNKVWNGNDWVKET